MDRKPQAPGCVRWVTQTLEEAGYETWTVGGAIRNTLLGLASGDWDMATRAPPKVVRRLFPRTVPIGIEHGTVGVLTRDGVLLEVTTFRRDVQTSGRHAVVEFADTLQEDLARRDFTINAVAWHALRETFLDPFGGRDDLDARLLRTVGSAAVRFSEDYLRVLRGLRFSGRFQLRIESLTWEALCSSTGRLGILSPERIREELMKVLTQDPRPSGSLSLYRASGVLRALYPELAAVEGCVRTERGEDLLTHSFLLSDLLSPRRPLLRLTVLFHGVGVPEGSDGNRVSPQERGRERTAAFMIRNRYSNLEIKEVAELVGAGLEPPRELEDPAALRRWLHRTDPARFRSFGRIWVAKARLDQLRWGVDPGSTSSLIRRIRGVLQDGPPLAVEDLAITGRDLIALGLKPGPNFGGILNRLMDQVLENPSLNTRDQLIARVDQNMRGNV